MKDNFDLKQWIGGKERMLNTLPENPDIPKKFESEDDGYPTNLNESHGKATSISQLDPGDKFTFKGKEYTFIAHIEGEPNQARVILPSGQPSVVSFGGPINTDLEGGTSMADMGLGKGHHIDEGYYETSELEKMIRDLGYDGFEDFFNDNQGAEEAVEEFILAQKNFRDILGRTDDEDIYEEEDRDEELIAKLTPVPQKLEEEDYDADQAQKDDEENEERGYYGGLPLGEGKGQKAADELVYKLRATLFKKFSSDEYNEFLDTLKKTLDL